MSVAEVKYIETIASGKPTILGVRVEVIHGRFVAGETISELATDYAMGDFDIEKAIRHHARVNAGLELRCLKELVPRCICGLIMRWNPRHTAWVCRKYKPRMYLVAPGEREHSRVEAKVWEQIRLATKEWRAGKPMPSTPQAVATQAASPEVVGKEKETLAARAGERKA